VRTLNHSPLSAAAAAATTTTTTTLQINAINHQTPLPFSGLLTTTAASVPWLVEAPEAAAPIATPEIAGWLGIVTGTCREPSKGNFRLASKTEIGMLGEIEVTGTEEGTNEAEAGVKKKRGIGTGIGSGIGTGGIEIGRAKGHRRGRDANLTKKSNK
jgi:hypothetical protein